MKEGGQESEGGELHGYEGGDKCVNKEECGDKDSSEESDSEDFEPLEFINELFDVNNHMNNMNSLLKMGRGKTNNLTEAEKDKLAELEKERILIKS